MSSNVTNGNDGATKTHGNTTYYTGAAKEKVGTVLGNERMQAEGKVEKLQGESEYNAAQFKGQTQGVKDNVKGHAKDAIGGITGNQQMQAEGKLDKTSGQAQQKANQY
ncbi:4397_t:CDS:2 [Ambispora leptoticha]|uniref:4397_t:CDS:1 n=1 Tax=Ambispora leptoticha TaxID=144679 RepID=A0A9N9BBP9_9GLOM|nr:4397_t:CDS:2 [Ambispora leptoticha]